jgi:hypothetical protein
MTTRIRPDGGGFLLLRSFTIGDATLGPDAYFRKRWRTHGDADWDAISTKHHAPATGR